MAKKKRNKKMSQEKKALFTSSHSINSLSSLSPKNLGFNQKNKRTSKIHIPRKPR